MIDLTDQNFDKEALKEKGSILVYFWAAWCGPCLMAGPAIEELSEEYKGKIKVGKLNVDENPKMSQKYGVMSIPTVIIFNGGKEIKRQVGFPGKEKYQKMIEEALL